jgi:SlyX protein
MPTCAHFEFKSAFSLMIFASISAVGQAADSLSLSRNCDGIGAQKIHQNHPEPPSGNTMSTEDRINDLELRLTRQDDLVDTLNTQVYRQQKKIDELEALCTALAARIREIAVTSNQRTAVADERPPHY